MISIPNKKELSLYASLIALFTVVLGFGYFGCFPFRIQTPEWEYPHLHLHWQMGLYAFSMMLCLVFLKFLIIKKKISIQDLNIEFLFTKKSIGLALLGIWTILYIYERYFFLDFVRPLRIDHEQGIWMGSSTRHAGQMLRGNLQWSLRSGVFHNGYSYLTALFKIVFNVENSRDNQMLNVLIVGIGYLFTCLGLIKFKLKGVAVCFLMISFFAGISHMMGYHLKYHTSFPLFFGLLFWLMAKIHEKPSYLNALLISPILVAGFICHPAMIFYLPISLTLFISSKLGWKKTISFMIIFTLPISVVALTYFLEPHISQNSYVTHKFILFHPNPLRMFGHNLLVQFRFLFIPRGVMSFILVFLFVLGVARLVMEGKKKHFFTLSLLLPILSKCLVREQALDHNFIYLIPVFIVAAMGFSMLLGVFHQKKHQWMVLGIVGVLLSFEVPWFMKDESWQKIHLFKTMHPLKGRPWYLDDAEKISEFRSSEHRVLMDPDFMVFEHPPNSYGIARAFKDMEGFNAVDFPGFKKDPFYLQKYCQYYYVTEKSEKKLKLQMPEVDYSFELRTRYRPKNPRFNLNQTEPDVFHYIYFVERSHC